MSKQTLNRQFMITRLHPLLLALFLVSSLFIRQSSAQSSPLFRVGEKLTYSLSFGKFRNTGYAELYVASRGKLGARDAIEIRAKARTFDLVSAAFLMLDE